MSEDLRCARCDLLVGQCEHTMPERRRHPGLERLLISPHLMAHLPGCQHNTDSDFSQWGEIHDDPRAWERLGNGQQVPANAGANRELTATHRCTDCARRA